VSCERRVPAEHPLRAILPITDAALAALSGDFEQLYAVNGRPSIAPEKLLRALLLQAFYSVRSERQLMEQLDYNLLFRWFVGLGVDDPVWAVTVFTKNRDRLLEGEIAAKFLRAVLAQPKVKALLSDEHFSIDGTLIQAWASMKSFRPKDGSGEPPAPGRNGERNFHGEQRTNDSHASTTDPEARLFRKGKGKEGPWCTDQRDDALAPIPPSGSRDADGLRAAELEHAVQGMDGHGDLGRLMTVRARAERVSDHPLVAGDRYLGQSATIVS
jgi:transposase